MKNGKHYPYFHQLVQCLRVDTRSSWGTPCHHFRQHFVANFWTDWYLWAGEDPTLSRTIATKLFPCQKRHEDGMIIGYLCGLDCLWDLGQRTNRKWSTTGNDRLLKPATMLNLKFLKPVLFFISPQDKEILHPQIMFSEEMKHRTGSNNKAVPFLTCQGLVYFQGLVPECLGLTWRRW